MTGSIHLPRTLVSMNRPLTLCVIVLLACMACGSVVPKRDLFAGAFDIRNVYPQGVDVAWVSSGEVITGYLACDDPGGQLHLRLYADFGMPTRADWTLRAEPISLKGPVPETVPFFGFSRASSLVCEWSFVGGANPNRVAVSRGEELLFVAGLPSPSRD